MGRMSEMAAFLNRKRSYPLCVIQFPSKRWGFVGSVPAALAFEGDPEEAAKRAQFGGRFVKTRAWDTKEEALNEAERLGFKVTG